MAGIGNVVANSPLVEMAMSYSRSRVLCAAGRLGVADAFGGEIRPLALIAEACQADPNSLYRLLRALAAIGITEETTPEHFRLTDFGRPLRRDAPGSVWPDVIFWADLLADEWTLLPDCIRSGSPAYKLRDPQTPSRWSQTPDASAIFRAVMGTAPAEDYAPIAEAWDFSGARVVADLGGGAGSLLLALLGRYPRLRGMLVDLEPSIAAAHPRFTSEPRCDLIVADLLLACPAGADVYVIKQVLHGRRDADAITMMRHIRAVIPPDGRLLIVEFVLPSMVSAADPQLEIHLMSDLNMLAVTGGKERSEREWKALLDQAGFALTAVYPVGGDTRMTQNAGIVEAAPV